MRFLVPVLLTGILLSSAGCSDLVRFLKGENEQKGQSKPAYIHHKVQYPGETIGIISSWYTGSANNWKAILNHNPGLNPRVLKKGATILIPGWLTKTEKPMPASYLVERQRRAPPIIEDGMKDKKSVQQPEAPINQQPPATTPDLWDPQKIIIEIQPTPIPIISIGPIDPPTTEAPAPHEAIDASEAAKPFQQIPEIDQVLPPADRIQDTQRKLEPLPTPTVDFRSEERKKLLEELMEEVGN